MFPKNLCRRCAAVWKPGVLCRICSIQVGTTLCQSFETGSETKPRKNAEDGKVPEARKPQISFADGELLQQGIVLEPLLQSISGRYLAALRQPPSPPTFEQMEARRLEAERRQRDCPICRDWHRPEFLTHAPCHAFSLFVERRRKQKTDGNA